jgi:GNAT superfamily N-acetyltransferase
MLVYVVAAEAFGVRAAEGRANRRALQALVESGAMPGLLGYQDGQPVAWVAVAPREAHPVLERSRNLKRVDDRPAWSITCLFVARPFRRQGISVHLLGAAVEHARRNGAQIVEGYPIEPQTGEVPAVFAWTGLASAFRQAGFAEVLRRAPTRPIMRFSNENKEQRTKNKRAETEDRGSKIEDRESTILNT